MKLGTFAGATTILLVAVVAAVSFSMFHVISTLKSASSTIDQSAESIFLAQELRVEIAKLELPSSGMDPEEIHVHLDALIKSVEPHVSEGTEAETLAALRNELSYLRTAELPAESPHLARAGRLALSLATINREQAEELRKDINEHYRLGIVIACLASGFVLALSVALLVAVRRLLLRPLTSILHDIQRFAEGQAIEPVPDAYIGEIKYIREALRSMAQTIRGNEQRQLEFVAGVAHDIRNPLNSLSLAIRLLAKDELPDRREVARICTQQIQYLNILLEDLIDRSRVQAGTLQLRLDRQNLNDIVYEVFELYRESNPRHQFNLRCPSEPLFVMCDRNRLMQVLHNLTTNAVKYSPEGGEVRLCVQRTEDRAVITVSDSGLGIRQSELVQIFEPFRRGSQTAKIQGVGLGLAVSKYIVEQHHGSIAVRSEVGRGSEFQVDLPLQGAFPVSRDLSPPRVMA